MLLFWQHIRVIILITFSLDKKSNENILVYDI